MNEITPLLIEYFKISIEKSVFYHNKLQTLLTLVDLESNLNKKLNELLNIPDINIKNEYFTEQIITIETNNVNFKDLDLDSISGEIQSLINLYQMKSLNNKQR